MSKFPLTVREIAAIVGGTVQGDDSVVIESVSSLEKAKATDITFATNPRYAAKLQTSAAGAAVVADEPAEAPMPLIRTAHVEEALAKLLGSLAEPADRLPAGIDPTAIIDETAQIAPDAAIGPFVVIAAGTVIGKGSTLLSRVCIGKNVQIGEQSLLHEGVVIKHNCLIGSRVMIGPNSVIGFDGFGYYFKDGKHNKIPHIGNVVIEDDVDIGAGTCIDRAKFDVTLIGQGTIVDNLAQIAHNVQIGRACILAGQVGIAGSSKLGKGVVIGGHSGVTDNVEIGDGAIVGGFSAIAADVEPGAIVAGSPAGPARDKLRSLLALDKLPETMKRIKAIEKRLSTLESTEDH